jgi:23S rRNA G2445 N2-methylase RlmL
MSNKSTKTTKQNKNDCIYTPKPLAKTMIELCELKKKEKVLDPCYGGGAIFDQLPKHCKKYWCEIELEKDFFDFKKTIDVIICNPPYSLMDDFIDKTLVLSPSRFCFLFSMMNINEKRLQRIFENGYGLTKFHLASVDWFFGRSLICVFEKNKPSIITITEKTVMCDLCGGRCGRGRISKNGKKNNYNECAKKS